MGQKFANNAKTRLASDISTLATSFTVTTGEGALFPTVTLGGQDHFLVTFENSSGDKEIARVIGRSGDTFQIGRIVDGSSSQVAGEGRGLDNPTGIHPARAFSAGDLVELRLTAGFIDEIKKGTVVFVIDGGGSLITAGVKGFIEVPFGGTIEAARAFADNSGSISVIIYKQNYLDYPFDPTDVPVDEITDSTGGHNIIISGDFKSQQDSSTGLIGWTRTFTPGDIFVFEVIGIPVAITKCTISLTVDRSYDPAE